jgi:quinohemoprotein ethanol dehydrogenase
VLYGHWLIKPFEASKEGLVNGRRIYGAYCGKCHAGGIIPDLKTATPETFEIFHLIVGQGAFLGKGMPNFGDRLSEQDMLDVKHYILNEAQLKRANGE